MSGSNHVIVVGGGPTGILNALGLARAGIEVTLLEREPAIVSSPRAMVYHWTVLQGLDDLGILDTAEQAGFTKQDYAFCVYETGEMIRYSLAPLEGHTRYPYNLHLGQDRLARLGLDELLKLDHVHVHFGWELASVRQDDDTVTAVSSDGEQAEVTGAFLVGADGAGSGVRKSLGLDFDGVTWDERFVATDIRYDFTGLGYSRTTMVVDPRHGAIVAKADEHDATGLWRYTFSEREQNETWSDGGLRERVADRLTTTLPGGSEAQIERFSPYRMHQRSASTMRVGRIVLAGDAAHVTNPTGGLGLATGLLDTYVLYPALTDIVQGRAPAEILDRYSAERLAVFRDHASPAATANKRFVFNSDDPIRLAADLERLRAELADPVQLMARLRFTERLITPALVPAPDCPRT